MNKINNTSDSSEREYFAEGIMLYDEEDSAWKKELMIAQIMVYLEKKMTQESLNILYGKENVDIALSILKPEKI